MQLIKQLNKTDYNFIFRLSFFSSFSLSLIIRWAELYIFNTKHFNLSFYIFLVLFFFFFYSFFENSLIVFFRIFSSAFFTHFYVNLRQIIPFNQLSVMLCAFVFWLIVEKSYFTFDNLLLFKVFVFLFSIFRVFIFIFYSFTLFFTSDLYQEFKKSSFLITITEIRRGAEIVETVAKFGRGWQAFDGARALGGMIVTGGTATFVLGKEEQGDARDTLETEHQSAHAEVNLRYSQVDDLKIERTFALESKNPAVQAKLDAAYDEKLDHLKTHAREMKAYQEKVLEEIRKLDHENVMITGLNVMRSVYDQEVKLPTHRVGEIVAERPNYSSSYDDLSLNSCLEKIFFFFFY